MRSVQFARTSLLKAGNSTFLRRQNVIIMQRNTMFTEAFASIPSVPDVLQTVIQAVQASTSLPWYATLGLSTIFVKLTLFPLIRQQAIEGRILASAMPDIMQLNMLFKDRIREVSQARGSFSEQVALAKIYTAGLKAACDKNDVSLTHLLAFPILNMSMFITFVYSIRSMILKNGTAFHMNEGGFAWFTDLTVADPHIILPMVAASLSYLGVEAAFKRAPGGTGGGDGMLWMKDLSQCVAIITLPWICTLPAGVFWYWIPSSLFNIVQTMLMKNPKFLAAIGVPEMSVPMANMNGVAATAAATGVVVPPLNNAAAMAAVQGATETPVREAELINKTTTTVDTKKTITTTTTAASRGGKRKK